MRPDTPCWQLLDRRNCEVLVLNLPADTASSAIPAAVGLAVVQNYPGEPRDTLIDWQALKPAGYPALTKTRQLRVIIHCIPRQIQRIERADRLISPTLLAVESLHAAGQAQAVRHPSTADPGKSICTVIVSHRNSIEKLEFDQMGLRSSVCMPLSAGVSPDCRIIKLHDTSCYTRRQLRRCRVFSPPGRCRTLVRHRLLIYLAVGILLLSGHEHNRFIRSDAARLQLQGLLAAQQPAITTLQAARQEAAQLEAAIETAGLPAWDSIRILSNALSHECTIEGIQLEQDRFQLTINSDCILTEIISIRALPEVFSAELIRQHSGQGSRQWIVQGSFHAGSAPHGSWKRGI